MARDFVSFLTIQNERLKFYEQSFWSVTNFFSTIVLLLLSSPFAIWLHEQRPHHWTLIACLAPALAVVVACVAHDVLKRTAHSYYAATASVMVLERLLGFQRWDGVGEPTVSASRIETSSQGIDDLAGTLNARLSSPFSTSRMAAILWLFHGYAAVAIVELVVLALNGLWGTNLVEVLVQSL